MPDALLDVVPVPAPVLPPVFVPASTPALPPELVTPLVPVRGVGVLLASHALKDTVTIMAALSAHHLFEDRVWVCMCTAVRSPWLANAKSAIETRGDERAANVYCGVESVMGSPGNMAGLVALVHRRRDALLA
ncbi:hypothetical protein FXN63_07865 [Pigmentiphaga aceris]|uniref:Uncharacterized protein n=1 Tax=Pigmentiphaga aceris TaxID=1940612 RepID=A0A5C0AWL1_9BURK|nr:hypothetical protein [Pigmentiphaga aceris]QEI05773.1 hypothetical protein FXN63_07865 [Pigmentiphaga aceris]